MGAAAQYTKRLQAMTLGQFIKELRTVEGVTLRSLATASELSASFLSDVELGRRSCRVETLGKIAKGLTKCGIPTTPDALAMKLRNDRIRAIETELKELKRAADGRR